MAKIYYRKYRQRIDKGEITLEQALALVDTEVPERWRAEVKALLNGE
jgi:hypothetical protein